MLYSAISSTALGSCTTIIMRIYIYWAMVVGIRTCFLRQTIWFLIPQSQKVIAPISTPGYKVKAADAPPWTLNKTTALVHGTPIITSCSEQHLTSHRKRRFGYGVPTRGIVGRM